MITLPKFDLEKLVNEVALAADGSQTFRVRCTIAVSKGIPTVAFSAETGVTTMLEVVRPTPETLVEGIKTNLQQVYFQLNTNTAKTSGKRARDRVRLATGLFKEIFPDGELAAFKDGDFVFCRQIPREDTKKYEEALVKHGWSLGKKQPEHDGHGNEIKGTGGEHWTLKLGGQNMKLPENQDKASFSCRISPVPTMWKILHQNGRDPFEFWFDEFSS